MDLLEEIMNPDTVTGLITSIGSALLLLGLFLLWRAIKPRLDRVLGQTENSHSNTEYPNLRDEVTAIRLQGEAMTEAVQTLAATQTALAKTVQEDRSASRQETEGVRTDVRSLSQRLDVHIAASAASVARQAPPSEGA